MTNTWRTFILLTILVSIYGKPLKALRVVQASLTQVCGTQILQPRIAGGQAYMT
jgi:hypothetical protein